MDFHGFKIISALLLLHAIAEKRLRLHIYLFFLAINGCLALLVLDEILNVFLPECHKDVLYEQIKESNKDVCDLLVFVSLARLLLHVCDLMMVGSLCQL